ncbi:MAG: cysteine desulfurase family protein [Anaerolineae bacterium]
MRYVYLDHSATTPTRPEVLQAMAPYWEERAGNPSSLHQVGQQARQALDESRERVASALGAHPEEIYFTGGGTESDNLAVLGSVYARQRTGHVITSAVEHHAVLNACRWLETQGYAVTYLPVDHHGLVDPETVRDCLQKDTLLVSIMLANNEVGTIQPVGEIAQLAREREIAVHTDAVQAVGKMPVRVDELGVDLLALTAHKFGGPKGVGALYIRKGTRVAPLLFGGHQEGALRPGTQNIPGIVGLATALELATAELASEPPRLGALRDRLERALTTRLPHVVVNGHPTHRLPNILNVSFVGTEGEALLLALDLHGVAVSTASACAAGSSEPSHVLQAMGVNANCLRGGLRFSLGHSTDSDDIEYATTAVIEVVERLRAIAPVFEEVNAGHGS